MNRRGLLLGILGLATAPAIVRASSIMTINTKIVAPTIVQGADFWKWEDSADFFRLTRDKLLALGISPEFLSGEGPHYSTVYEHLKHYGKHQSRGLRRELFPAQILQSRG